MRRPADSFPSQLGLDPEVALVGAIRGSTLCEICGLRTSHCRDCEVCNLMFCYGPLSTPCGAIAEHGQRCWLCWETPDIVESGTAPAEMVLALRPEHGWLVGEEGQPLYAPGVFLHTDLTKAFDCVRDEVSIAKEQYKARAAAPPPGGPKAPALVIDKKGKKGKGKCKGPGAPEI